MRIEVNGEVRVIAAGTSVRELLEALDLGSDRVAVELNGELVPRRLHGETRLAEGDRIEVVTLVGGG